MGNLSIDHDPDPSQVQSHFLHLTHIESKSPKQINNNHKDLSSLDYHYNNNTPSLSCPDSDIPKINGNHSKDLEVDKDRLSVSLSPGSNWGDNIITQTLGKMDSKDTVVEKGELDVNFTEACKTLNYKKSCQNQERNYSLPLDTEKVVIVNLQDSSTTAKKNILNEEIFENPSKEDNLIVGEINQEIPAIMNGVHAVEGSQKLKDHSSSDSGNVNPTPTERERGPLPDSAYSTIAPMFTEEPDPVEPEKDPSELALPRNAYSAPLKLRAPPSLTSIRSQPNTETSFDPNLQYQIKSSRSQTNLTDSTDKLPSSTDSGEVILLSRRNTYSAPSSQLRRKLTGSQRTQRILKRVTPRSGNQANLINSNPAKYGTNVGEGHDNYALMYNMLTGIRVSVSRCTAKPKRPLAREDFLAANKLAFDVTGNELTPSSKYDFKFKDYAPTVFRAVRDLFGLDPAEYLLSLTLKYILSELSTPGKSGSFFYYSQDFRFIIKTVHHNEHKFFRKILPGYYNHVQANPNTLISRIYGLHRVKMHHTTKIHFVVMANLFPPTKDIHAQFDLKGSTFGRYFDEAAASSAKIPPVLKDLNWLQQKRKMHLGPSKRNALYQQIRNDVDFLALHNIMDYSLLLGIHSLQRGNRDKLRQATLSLFDASSLQNKGTASNTTSYNPPEDSDAPNVGSSQNVGGHRLPLTVAEDRLHCIFYSDGGGFLATTEHDTPGDELYCMGIIDIMTPYSIGKRIEHVIKSIGKDASAISAVDPKSYAHRFLAFITRSLAHHEDLDVQLAEYSASHPTKFRPKQE